VFVDELVCMDLRAAMMLVVVVVGVFLGFFDEQ
jgi:hypothetical protein